MIPPIPPRSGIHGIRLPTYTDCCNVFISSSKMYCALYGISVTSDSLASLLILVSVSAAMPATIFFNLSIGNYFECIIEICAFHFA